MENCQNLKLLRFCDINLVDFTRDEFADFAVQKARERNSYISFSLNGESLAKFHNDSEFRKLFLNSDFVHADGMSIVSASKLVAKPGLPERIATTDWFHDVAKRSIQDGLSHYFLGADPVTIEKTIENVRKQYPNIKIAGYHHGYFKASDDKFVLDEIDRLSPHFVWVGLGRPRQETFAIKIKEACHVGIIKTCGGLFDFLAGNNRRAPKLMQQIGLEWLFRLYLQPKRLFKRYLVTNYQSTVIVLSYLFSHRIESVSKK